jgi:dTDP-4-dehydrorhamnose 3,5-epimerase
MSSLTIIDLPIAGLRRIDRTIRADDRGFLTRLFCAEELVAAGWSKPVAQVNHTSTRTRAVVRGIHFQYPPHAEMKLVSCIRGAVFDVAVDLRKGSPTFLKWHAEEVSAANARALLIPEGFGHGFQALTDDCELLYAHSAAYAAEAEGALNATDPALAIAWPLPIGERSERDAQHALLQADFEGIVL